MTSVVGAANAHAYAKHQQRREENKSVTRYNGVDRGSIVIQLNTNHTYMETDIVQQHDKPTTTLGSYKIVGNHITLTTDNGVVHEYTITKMDETITKMSAGERVMYFIRSN
jgi:hypothetical protein